MTSCNEKFMLEAGSWNRYIFFYYHRMVLVQVGRNYERLARRLNFWDMLLGILGAANTPNWLGQPLGENLRGLIKRRGNEGNWGGPCRARVNVRM